MRVMRAEQFSGYEGLKLVDLPKPAVTDGKVLVRITAAGVTPLDHTILSGKFHGSKPPLVLGNEGAGVVAKMLHDDGGRLKTIYAREGISCRAFGWPSAHQVDSSRSWTFSSCPPTSAYVAPTSFARARTVYDRRRFAH